jgi:hypothetical protein
MADSIYNSIFTIRYCLAETPDTEYLIGWWIPMNTRTYQLPPYAPNLLGWIGWLTACIHGFLSSKNGLHTTPILSIKSIKRNNHIKLDHNPHSFIKLFYQWLHSTPKFLIHMILTQLPSCWFDWVYSYWGLPYLLLDVRFRSAVYLFWSQTGWRDQKFQFFFTINIFCK